MNGETQKFKQARNVSCGSSRDQCPRYKIKQKIFEAIFKEFDKSCDLKPAMIIIRF